MLGGSDLGPCSLQLLFEFNLREVAEEPCDQVFYFLSTSDQSTSVNIVGILEYIKELAAESEQSKKPDE